MHFYHLTGEFISFEDKSIIFQRYVLRMEKKLSISEKSKKYIAIPNLLLLLKSVISYVSIIHKVLTIE